MRYIDAKHFGRVSCNAWMQIFNTFYWSYPTFQGEILDIIVYIKMHGIYMSNVVVKLETSKTIANEIFTKFSPRYFKLLRLIYSWRAHRIALSTIQLLSSNRMCINRPQWDALNNWYICFEMIKLYFRAVVHDWLLSNSLLLFMCFSLYFKLSAYFNKLFRYFSQFFSISNRYVSNSSFFVFTFWFYSIFVLFHFNLNQI